MDKKPADVTMPGDSGLQIPPMLLNCGFDVDVYRQRQFETNATTLRYDEHKYIETEVQKILRIRQVIVNDLIAYGLTILIPNGLGKKLYQYEDVSDMSDAQISMSAEAADQGDRVVFNPNYLPLPVCHKGFSLSARDIAGSRDGSGTPLDTTHAETAAEKVAEKTESVFAVGNGTQAWGGNTIYGLLNFTSKQDFTVAAHWNDSGADPVADVRQMKQYAKNHYHHGPYMVYVPTLWEEVLDDNFTTNYPITVRDRIMQIEGILGVKACDSLTADYCVLVEFQKRTIAAVIGLQPTMIDWSPTPMVSSYKIMQIIWPLIRTDQASKSGVVVGTK